LCWYELAIRVSSMNAKRILGLVVAVLLLAVAGEAQEITVAAAADLQGAFKELLPKFEASSGVKVKCSFGSSGNIASQIRNGAPYDMFFSADAEYPLALQKDGLTEPNSLYEYAVGRIVLWAPNGAKFDVRNGLKALLEPAVHKVAIGNPQHAPYGRAAVAALKSAGVYEQVRTKFVLGENISQAAQFVQTGNADAGIIALSLAMTQVMKDSGKYTEIDPKTYPELRQAAVVLKSAKNKTGAVTFLTYIKSAEARDLLKRYGFVVAGDR